ncbi:MAG: 50S ribosomal protein L11 methyltransferase [Clostridia bacterium]|nr:50S ribosomal protein L11 methyltransferase [Clostridia bacterium]
MKDYLELTVHTTHQASELVSDIMWNYTDLGVAVNDIQDVIDLERDGKAWDYADESIYSQDKTVLVKAYFPLSDKKVISQVENDLFALKQNCPFNVGTLETVKREVDGDEWRVTWKEHFKPIHLGKIVVVPEWIEYTCQQGEIPVYLDSNMAFGTGEHETTSMCVEALEKYVKPNDCVIDVGCGSGILGISASKLGAKEVIMTDIDECAVTATERNVKLNGVTNAQVYLKNLLDDTTVKGQVIVCNIMAEVLIAFAPFIGANLTDNGRIILSGILVDRLEKVKEAYQKCGFTFVEQRIKGEWSLLVMKKVTYL